MIAPLLDGPGPVRSRLRAAVADVDHHLAPLRQESAGGESAATDGLLASWANLVELLALGPEPEVRACPHCRHVGMRAATRCGHCWAKLSPPATGADGHGLTP